MLRFVAPAVFALAVIAGLVGGPPTPSGADQGSASPTATPPPDNVCVVGAPMDADVQPSPGNAAMVVPAGEAEPNDLHLVVITLPPGHCVPYSSKGNQKNGAIVLMVQQGHLNFHWVHDPAVVGIPQVEHGNAAGPSGPVPEDTTQSLSPGDWITLNQQVWFSYSNVGGDNAVILKAVWAATPMGGCSGGCK